MKRLFASLALVALVSGCAANTGGDSSFQEVAAAAYRAPGQPTLTVFTMVNNRTGGGGHTSLMVSGSQRVIFDPAGSFRDDRVVERGDVLYGMTPGWVQAYKSAHARSTFHVVSQEIPVTAAQAEQALRLVQANGSVPGAFCANATSGILAQIDGLPNVSSTYYPTKLMAQIDSFPNVTTTKLFEDDPDDLKGAVREVALAQ
ncbi:hypothetical protein [Sulfitobacter geojensis]|uniref:Lipoprotein n=1 Tax=Sulfitobacter geojensis TaxID=1342299 RepID=A0AAE2VZS9_9RHOB|nr:hypothetical protein [Sulfitobacter geojensis]MBM1690264.1 hypothetical protein [Sulfitobacter geojensis]MBM1694330.1 hypothetical protein [Sulfitobacter geojensis]MBM1706496.1 hypothetical protein [Sulfitobacter geojensis]MBM1710554.1 hypothetical protein [Sulfitobacter geojensis]MBM1714620.1 hypothetical protein [Sulfitobacter geojensis]